MVGLFHAGKRTDTLGTGKFVSAGIKAVMLDFIFLLGAMSHCKIFHYTAIPPSPRPWALRVDLQLNWFWLANENRTVKLNFQRNVVNLVWGGKTISHYSALCLIASNPLPPISQVRKLFPPLEGSDHHTLFIYVIHSPPFSLRLKADQK